MKQICLIFLLVIGATSQILDRIKGDPSTIFRISDWKTYKSFREIRAVIESNRFIYIATDKAGILRFNKLENRFDFPLTKSNGLLADEILQVYAAKNDSGMEIKQSMLIISAKGSQVLALDPFEQSSLQKIPANLFEKDPNYLGISALKSDETYFLDSYYMKNHQKISDNSLREYEIIGKYENKSGSIWLFVKDIGIFYGFSKASQLKLISPGLANDQINCLSIFNEQIYCGYAKNQRFLWSNWTLDNHWQHFDSTLKTSIQFGSVNRFTQIGDSLLLATDNGILLINKDNQIVKEIRFDGLYSAKIYDLFAYDSLILVGSSKGLYSLHRRNFEVNQLKFSVIGNVDIFSVAENKSFLFVVTRFGIYKIDKIREKVESLNVPFVNNYTQFVYLDEKDRFWFNNSTGLFYFDSQKETITQITLSSPDFRLQINRMTSSAENLFLASNKGLIMYLEKTNRWLWITEREGLVSNQLTDIVLDGDYLIISSAKGLSEFYWNDSKRHY